LNPSFDAIILGAGAAGLMAAASAGQRGKRVLVLDHSGQPGSKILISGGGRCNFTNREVTPANYLSGNPHFVTSALKRFSHRDFLDLVGRHRIPWHERDHGRLFCDDSAQRIVDLLLAECAQGRVEIRSHCRINEVSGDGPYHLATSQGSFEAPALVVATGGLSLPKLGASGLGHQIAKRYGLGVTPLLPALSPLLLSDADIGRLAGISLDVEIKLGKAVFHDALLFTHKGLSGPATLQISSYWRPGQEISIGLAPGIDVAHWLADRRRARPKAQLETLAAELLPARLAEMVMERAKLGQIAAGQASKAQMAAFIQAIKDWRLIPSAPQGYGVAEATLGGVDCGLLSSKTMEAKGRPGLFFVGEVMDVTGQLGGYNFQWAWSSGWVAGQSL
jgi:predicted Rossmann fold flavoprotein